MAKAKAKPPAPALQLLPNLPLDQGQTQGESQAKPKKGQQVCDKASQYAIHIARLAFFLFILKRLHPATAELLGFLSNRPAGLPTSPLRICDFIVALKIHGKALLEVINFEIQIRAKGNEITRGLDYIKALIEAYKFIRAHLKGDFVLGTCFVYLRGKAKKPMSISMETSRKPGYTGPSAQLNFVSDSFYMAEVNASEFLKQVSDGEESADLLYWVPLMDGADQEGIIVEWRRLVDIHIAQNEKSNLALVAEAFAEAAEREEIWEPHLEDLEPMKSKLHEKWYAAAEARGEAKGAIDTLRHVLLLLLTQKFPRVVETASNLLQNLNDQTRLDELYRHALQAKTEKEFRNLAGV